MKSFLAILSLLVCGAALAGTASATWTAPVQNTDGSAITAADGITYNLQRNLNGGAFSKYKTGIAALTYVDTVGPGVWCYTVTAVNLGGVESDPSNQDCKTIAWPKPGKPGTLTLAGGPAFAPKFGIDDMQLVNVGTVPAKKNCDATQSINGMSRVPRAIVKLKPGQKRPDVVFSVCVS